MNQNGFEVFKDMYKVQNRLLFILDVTKDKSILSRSKKVFFFQKQKQIAVHFCQ